MAHTVIQDQVGRTIIGKVVEDTPTSLVLNNPVILHCQMDDTGNLQVQTFPAFFFEFIDKAFRENNNWTYSKSSIVTSDVTLDAQVISQYEKLNSPLLAKAPTKNDNPKVISINDL
jgi:hypothetical protein